MKKANTNKITQLINRGQYNRLIVSKDLYKYDVFGLYESYQDKAKCDVEMIIDDRWQTYTKTQIKKEIKEFLDSLK